MLAALHALILALVAYVGWAVVTERDPLKQSMIFSLFGLLLAVQFVMVQAVDVALSQLVVGAVAMPLMLLLTLAKAGAEHAPKEHGSNEGDGAP